MRYGMKPFNSKNQRKITVFACFRETGVFYLKVCYNEFITAASVTDLCYRRSFFSCKGIGVKCIM